MSLFLQDGRGLSALGSGLSIFPEALGVMAGAQLASRVIYPVLGPRRNIAFGELGVAASIGLMTLVGAQTSLWWLRLLMFCLGVAQGQVFVPAQAAAFATISPEATGRASTVFNVIRQLGSATGVAVMSSVLAAGSGLGQPPRRRIPNCFPGRGRPGRAGGRGRPLHPLPGASRPRAKTASKNRPGTNRFSQDSFPESVTEDRIPPWPARQPRTPRRPR